MNVERVPFEHTINILHDSRCGEGKTLRIIITETKMRIPIWYHPNDEYYDILLDDVMESARLGCLQINKKGFRYVRVPIGKVVAVDEGRLQEIDDPSKEVILNGGE